MPLGLAKRITTMLSSAEGMSRAIKGLRCPPWARVEITWVRVQIARCSSHSRAHAAQDGVGHRFGAVAALVFVAPEFLYPSRLITGEFTPTRRSVLGRCASGCYHWRCSPRKQHVGVQGRSLHGVNVPGLR